MNLLAIVVTVTGFLFSSVSPSAATATAAAQHPTGSRSPAAARLATEPAAALRQRIETSRGTCECVPYFQCDENNTVDTVEFRIRPVARIQRQIEARPEQCVDLNVCCLVQTGGNTVTSPTSTSPTTATDEVCLCLPQNECSKENLDRLTGGAGTVQERIKCEAGLVQCCEKSAETLGPPSPTPTTTPIAIPRTCGTRNKKIDFNLNRIQTAAGDGSTFFGEYPWTLVILKTQTLADQTVSSNVFVCGASLIQPSIAITAAHCVHQSEASELKIRAGEWDTTDNNIQEILPFQEQPVTEIILHPQFSNTTLHNDIAIIRLANPFTLADNVGLICIPNDVSSDPSNCIATGWGKEAFAKASKYQSVMKQVSLPFMPSDECEQKLRKTRLGQHFLLNKSFMCAGGRSNEDTCQGDGGGPLSCIVDGDDQFYLIGITSWGIGCGSENVPGVYTNIRHFSNWISDFLQ